MKRQYVQILLLFLICIGLAGCQSGKKVSSLSEVCVDNKIVTLKAGDEVVATRWNEPEQTYNGKSIKKVPKLYGDISIGSEMEDVIQTFGLKKGFALINYEYDPYQDGCTDIKTISYTDAEFMDKEHVLDAKFYFGYKVKKDDQPLSEKELRQYLKGTYKPKETIVIYMIDINGTAGDAVPKSQVIELKVHCIGAD